MNFSMNDLAGLVGGGGQGGMGGGGIMQLLGQIFGGGVGASAAGGGPSMQALTGLLNNGGSGSASNYQQVQTPGQTPGAIGGVDIPPADLRDPFGGPAWSNVGVGDPTRGNSFFSGLGIAGFNPVFNSPISGGTISPTFWSNANTGGAGFAPIAIPAGGWTPGNILNIGTHRHTGQPKPV